MPETDFRTFIAKMRARQIDGLIVCLFPDAAPALGIVAFRCQPPPKL